MEVKDATVIKTPEVNDSTNDERTTHVDSTIAFGGLLRDCNYSGGGLPIGRALSPPFNHSA